MKPDTAEELFEQLQDLQVEIEELYQASIKGQSDTDNALNDIAHYIEFNDLSASQGFSIYKKEQEIRRERRVHKRNLIITSAMRNNLIFAKPQGELEKIINKQARKTYRPRILKELFENE